MRVMGVDPGLTRCGLSVVESGRGRKIVALDVDVVRTPSDAALPKRLLAISDAVEHWLDTHHPDVIAIERVFSQHNVSTVMGTAQAGGVVALAAAKRDIDVHFHTPSEVKAAVTGNGAADKAQVDEFFPELDAVEGDVHDSGERVGNVEAPGNPCAAPDRSGWPVQRAPVRSFADRTLGLTIIASSHGREPELDFRLRA